MLKIKNFKMLICLLLAAASFAACSDTETYADQKKKERSAINRYIANQKIKVISEAQFIAQDSTTDTLKNEFVLFDNTGVYMQIIRKGDEGEILKDGESATVLCRFKEYNLLESDSTLQSTNINRYTYCTDKMTVTNTSGTLTGVFDKNFCVMYTTYKSTAVPAGWLVPLKYIRLARRTDRIAKVKIIVPHSQGQDNAAQNVYPCLYELTYQRGR